MITRRHFITLTGAALAVSCAGGLAGCSEGTTAKESAVFLPISWVVENDNQVDTVTVSYDPSGNILTHTRLTTKTNSGTRVTADGASRYGAGDTETFKKDFTYDDKGMLIGIALSSGVKYEVATEADKNGKPAKITLSKEGSQPQDIYTYEYSDKGYFAKMGHHYAPKNTDTATNFNECGWTESDAYNGSQFTFDSNGRVATAKTSYGQLDFTYGENDCITEVKLKGKTLATIDYMKVEKPSPFAFAVAHAGINTGIALGELGGPEMKVYPTFL